MPKQLTQFLEDLAELLDKHNVSIEKTINGLCFKFSNKVIYRSRLFNNK